MEQSATKKTFPYVHPPGKSGPSNPDRPAHYRLSRATWDIILKEYIDGATVTELTSKYRVSMHAVRKRITQHGMQKQAWGDRQVLAQAEARAEELEEMRRNRPELRVAQLFKGMDPIEDDRGDPAELARRATIAAGRAMVGRLWAEAKALAGLAESFTRLGDGKPTLGQVVDHLPLEDLLKIVEQKPLFLGVRFSPRASDSDAVLELKARYWKLAEMPGEA